MSTRAMYSFRDKNDTFHVYKHHDGYPTGAAEWINNAAACAWPMPRFEADEFAAAFVAGNKSRPGGGVRLMHSGEWKQVASGDLDYRYEVYEKGGVLCVDAFDIAERDGIWHEKTLYSGTLSEFAKWAKAVEAATT